MKICRENCIFLQPKERNQKLGEWHICNLFDKRLYHKLYHPTLLAVENCPFARRVK